MPPDFRLPKGWVISVGGLVVPPFPAMNEAFEHTILTRRDKMMEAERNFLENDIVNWVAWNNRFMRQRDTF